MKKILIIILVFILLAGAGVIYVNKVILPQKIRSLIINGLQEATRKNVKLGALQFSIFKGLVLRDLEIYDEARTFLRVKETSCVILLPWLLWKKLIIPSMDVISPEVFLERRSDNTLNISDLFSDSANLQPKSRFDLFVSRVKITGGRIDFQDDNFAPPFVQSMQNINAVVGVSLSRSIKFNLKSEIPANPVIKIHAVGEFRLPDRQLTSKILINGFSPSGFLKYYQELGVYFPEGTTNALITLAFKNKILNLNVEAYNNNLVISKAGILARVNSKVNAAIQYNLENKQWNFQGKADVGNTDLQGINLVKQIRGIAGKVTFNNSGIFSDKLNAKALGLPIEAKVKLTDFNQPLIDINLTCAPSLDTLRQILKNNFRIAIPLEIKGASALSLSLIKMPQSDSWQIKGFLDFPDATVKFKKIVDTTLENIAGRLEFSPEMLTWSDLHFKYLGTVYKTSGTLNNFRNPIVQLRLSSKGLSLESDLALDEKMLEISRLQGRYLNSGFAIKADINTAIAGQLETQASGELKVNLEDLGEILGKFKDRLEKIKPKGTLNSQFILQGDIKNIKSCLIQAQLASSGISAYGLKSGKLLLNYSQEQGIIDISLSPLPFYDGSFEATARMNLGSVNLPYWVGVNVAGVNIARLKQDTPARDSDISGILKGWFKINGSSNDLDKLTGAGEAMVSEGKLWELNLFKGLGELLFAKDFARVLFSEGYCGFSIQDRFIASDNLRLKSNLANLEGYFKIGFDGSLDGSLNVQVLEEGAPETGTMKDVATAIIGQAGRFGVIKVSGTLKEPKYKFKAAVNDIIKSLKNAILGNILKK